MDTSAITCRLDRRPPHPFAAAEDAGRRGKTDVDPPGQRHRGSSGHCTRFRDGVRKGSSNRAKVDHPKLNLHAESLLASCNQVGTHTS